MSEPRKIGLRFSLLERLLGKLSLRAQVAILLAAAMLPVGGLSLSQGISNYTETIRLRQETFTLEALQAGKLEQAAIQRAFGALAALNSQIDTDAPRTACQTVFKNYTASTPGATLIGYVNNNGIMQCAVPEAEEGLNYSTYIGTARRSVTARESRSGPEEQVLILTDRIYGDGEARGALVMSVHSSYLTWVARNRDLAPEARFAIVTRDGVSIANSHGDDLNWLPEAPQLNRVLTAGDQVVEAYSRHGAERIFAIAPLFEQDIFAVAGWPEKSVAKSLGVRAMLVIALPILMWAMAIIVAYIAVDRLALRHILYLDRLVGAYGRSGRPLRARGMRDAPTEIAKLGASFDAMVEEIETRKRVLVDAVAEKEILLREVNHRVKNNLQMVSSLMSLQIREATTDHERIALERLQERIHGLAAVYRKIYESENMSEVRLDQLIAEIAKSLADTSAIDEGRIALSFDLHPVTTKPDRAVPITLFATEAIVNAFKHALAHAPVGSLRITLVEHENTLELGIVNSLPEKRPDAEDGRRGIGQRLSQGFAAQLRGTVDRVEGDGTYQVTLTVPKEGETGAPVSGA